MNIANTFVKAVQHFFVYFGQRLLRLFSNSEIKRMQWTFKVNVNEKRSLIVYVGTFVMCIGWAKKSLI